MRRAIFAARRRGAETLEFLATVVVMLIITAGCVLLTSAYGNALAAQHALSQTALFVAANGRYTQAIETRCAQMLPKSPGTEATCQAYRVDSNGQVIDSVAAARSVAEAEPVPFGERLRVVVTYSQPWFELCAPSFTGQACAGGINMSIQRHIDIPSLTREVRG